MKTHLNKINNKLQQLHSKLEQDPNQEKDIDFSLNFIPPYSNAANIKDIKLIILGQDPTVRREASRKEIKKTLNLDKSGSLRTYIQLICNRLNIDLDKEVYATNLYKCFFHQPPADNLHILESHRELWLQFLIYELNQFGNDITIITLGEPLIKQLITTKHKKVSYYWDYIGNTTSGKSFKCIKENENTLKKNIFPLPHQPSWSRNRFYKKYLNDYFNFILSTRQY